MLQWFEFTKFAWENTVIDIIAEIQIKLRSKMTIEKTSKSFLLQNYQNEVFHNTSIHCKTRVTFCVIKLGCYVIVDVGYKYVMFQALNFPIKIKKTTLNNLRKGISIVVSSVHAEV